MIQQDTAGIVVPFFAGSDHPIWDTLESWMSIPDISPSGNSSSSSGIAASTIELAPVSSRHLPVTLTCSEPSSAPSNALEQCSPAVNRRTRRTTGLSSSAHMDNDQGILTRWAVRPATSGWSELRIVGESGSAIVELGPRPGNLEIAACFT